MQLIRVGMCLLILFISGCGSGGGDISISSSGTCVGGGPNECLAYYYQQCVIDGGDVKKCSSAGFDKCGDCYL
jgi:hypothetical protein